MRRPGGAFGLPVVERGKAGLAHLAGPEASVQWAHWWSRELLQQDVPGRGFFAPDSEFGDGAELGASTRECFDDAVRWSSGDPEAGLTVGPSTAGSR
ncbi:hypothetical protein [Kitasatospora sp. GP82]|uniref:hypothetical protein n=1 Tax=Kitasatospora sp. GP82 TaxID=3035089 RepID=UPI0024751325|nr:hypothetical protein [Kitasatospora sp. GP82]MDH6126140.1 hypothetical protein [Kitasatospora sp. GP82]